MKYKGRHLEPSQHLPGHSCRDNELAMVSPLSGLFPPMARSHAIAFYPEQQRPGSWLCFRWSAGPTAVVGQVSEKGGSGSLSKHCSGYLLHSLRKPEDPGSCRNSYNTWIGSEDPGSCGNLYHPCSGQIVTTSGNAGRALILSPPSSFSCRRGASAPCPCRSSA